MSSLKYKLFKAYIYSFPFYTFVNPGGIMPFSLVFILLLIFVNFLKSSKDNKFHIPKINLLDFFFFSFLFISFFSVVINLDKKINYNHLISHLIVFLCYYYSVKVFVHKNKLLLLKNHLIFSILTKLFYIIAVSVFVDLFFHYIGINLADYLPLDTRNIVFGVGFTVRARGFFVEPTDLALALNIFSSILIAYFYEIKNFKKLKKIAFLYLVLLILSRSSSGLVQLVVGFFLVSFLYFFRSKFSRYISKKFFSNFIKISIFFTLITSVMFVTLNNAIREATNKLQFLSSVSDSSGDVRLLYWIDSLNMFMQSDQKFFGFGTGFTTLNQKTFNWFLTVLIENGIIGFFIIISIFIFSIYQSIKIKNTFSYALIFSYLSIFLHLMTNTGFYYPYIWLFFSLTILLKNFEPSIFKK